MPCEKRTIALSKRAIVRFGFLGYSAPALLQFMPITKGAQKAHRSSLRKRVYNLRRKNAMADIVKKVRKAVAAGNVAEAEGMMPEAYKAIDKAAKRGVIKENTAARKKSRLVATIKRGK